MAPSLARTALLVVAAVTGAGYVASMRLAFVQVVASETQPTALVEIILKPLPSFIGITNAPSTTLCPAFSASNQGRWR